METNKNTRSRILYIMGAGRSGSTILSILLGNHHEIENLGEVKKWADHRGLPRDRELKEDNLLFWQKVLDQYQNYSGKANFEEIKSLYDFIENNGKFMLNLLGCIDRKIVRKYEGQIVKLFRSIGKISGKVILLDSSKNLCRGIRLYRSSRVQAVIIYLVRDPRGVVWSFLKMNVEQKSKKSFRAAIDYFIMNVSALLFYAISNKKRVCMIRYEDLIENPKETLLILEKYTGLKMNNLIKKVQNRESFSTGYVIDGNRIRKDGSARFTPDLMWKEKMSYLMRFCIYVITLPLNIIFGYRP